MTTVLLENFTDSVYKKSPIPRKGFMNIVSESIIIKIYYIFTYDIKIDYIEVIREDLCIIPELVSQKIVKYYLSQISKHKEVILTNESIVTTFPEIFKF